MRGSRGPIFETDWVRILLPFLLLPVVVAYALFGAHSISKPDCSQRLLSLHKEATIEERDRIFPTPIFIIIFVAAAAQSSFIS